MFDGFFLLYFNFHVSYEYLKYNNLKISHIDYMIEKLKYCAKKNQSLSTDNVLTLNLVQQLNNTLLF